MSAPPSFAALILTHGRPDRVFTYETLRKSGYTGPIVLVVDDLDSTRDEYVARYGSEVVVFDKRAVAATFDQGDNFNDLRAIIYARNASFGIARRLGVSHFVQLDDDYTGFQYRFDASFAYRYRQVRNLDAVFAALVRFLDASGAASVAMAQGGDFIGGSESAAAEMPRLLRKCMNSFVCATDRPFQFVGRVNEDVNTYTRVASTGALFFTATQVLLCQKATQTNKGGMTETYLDGGTYLKSFYSVMYQPSSVKVAMLRDRYVGRLHHRVFWENTVPKILRESLRKPRSG